MHALFNSKRCRVVHADAAVLQRFAVYLLRVGVQ
jgi:hypothetical protein